MKLLFLKVIFLLALPNFFSSLQVAGGTINASLVDRAYELNNQQLFWQGAEGIAKRLLLVSVIDSCRYLGLDPALYASHQLRTLANLDEREPGKALANDRLFTSTALAIAQELKTGSSVARYLGYDELSRAARARDEQELLQQFVQTSDTAALRSFLTGSEPADRIYQTLKTELAREIVYAGKSRVRQLSLTMAYHRWTAHLGQGHYIVVNIPSATLSYFRGDSLKLRMRTVVGKPATKTPRFAAHCDKIVLYPYWNVPESIKPELLLVAFRKRSYLSALNLQIIDGKGRVVSPNAINWKAYSPYNFPYSLRQATGCDNALGIIKFNLTSPYAVYMHDTNVKGVFQHESRYYSHGCIRLEKPVELGNDLLHNRLDTSFLAACVRGQEPVTVPLEQPVPVFVIYAPCSVNDSGTVRYHRDIYHLKY